MTLRVQPLGDDHDCQAFHSGKDDLDRWLNDHARQAVGQGTRTYVLVDDEQGIVGYFAIAPHLVERDELPRKVGRGAPARIPAMLLAKLALYEPLHGMGLGGELLVAALTTIVEAARNAGGKLVIVDAIDQAAADFYRHHDFQPLPHRSDRLVMKLSTAAKVLGLSWP